MALTITYDGFGVIANADNIASDSAGGSWAEVGGGTISDNPDVYLYSGATIPQSIGNKYANRSGHTYFTAVTSIDISSGGTEEGQNIYFWLNIAAAGVFDLIANNGFSIIIGSDLSNYYEWTVAGSDDANGWTGGWKLFCIDPTLLTGVTIVGTPVLTAIDTFGVWIDTNASVRADTIFISQIMCAHGLNIEGTSTTMYDDIVTWCEDYINRAAGMFQSRGQTYYSLGSLSIHSDTANTVVSASGNNVEYEKSEFWNGTTWVTAYPTTANILSTADTAGNTVSLTEANVGMSGNASNKLQINTSAGTSYIRTGGYLKYLSSLILASTDNISSAVISLSNAIKSSGASLNNITINSTLETLTGAFELINASELTTIANLTFNTYTGKYALYIPSTVTGTISLNNFKGDGSGTDVYWDGADGTTLIINKANGTNFTTWATPGTAIVSLVTSVSINVNVKDEAGINISGVLVYVDEDLGAEGSIINTTTDINGNVNTSYSGAATNATIRLRKYGYKFALRTISLASDSSTNVVMIVDPQQT